MDQSRWIAFELHDGLMQWVIGARMHMEAMVAAIKEHRETDELETNLTQILSYLNQATEEGRQLIRFVEGLPAGETVDLVATLESTCELLTRKTRAGRPKIIFSQARPGESWPRLEPQFVWNVVRIIQQAAMNAVRHSQAEEVRIVVSGSLDMLVVVVADNGCGFNPDADYPGHYGLRSMKQRAGECGLALSIRSKPQQGTEVTLQVPLCPMPPDFV